MQTVMKRYLAILFALLLAACGYRMGGLKKTSMKKMNTFSVEMFDNETVFPFVAMQLTTALTDTMQRDGTYTMASSEKCDFKIRGAVYSVHETSQRTNTADTYLSSEIGLTVYVSYVVRDAHTGKEIVRSSVSAEGSYFNDTGSVETARDSALSYATRRAAELIVQYLTTP